MKRSFTPIALVTCLIAGGAPLSQGQRQSDINQRNWQEDQSYPRTDRWQDREGSFRTQGTSSTRARSGQQVLQATAGSIAQNPERYYGQQVRINAEVEEVFGVGVFTLDEDRLLARPDVLVVVPDAARAPRNGAQVTVTGTVREFTSAQVRRDYDWLAWNWDDYDDVWVDWDRRPVIIADSIRTDRGRELVRQDGQRQSGAQMAQGQRFQDTAQRTGVMAVSAGDVAADPDRYFGRTVRMQSEISDVYSPHAFTLDEDRLFAGPDVLVVVGNPAGQAVEGRRVTVEGTVEPFNRSQLEREYNWFSRGLLDQIDPDRRWDEGRRPVIIARSVRTDTGRELVQSTGGRGPGFGGTGQESVERGWGGGANQSLTSLQTLLQGENPNRWIGQRIDLRQAQVQRVLNSDWIMLGTARENQILVRVPGDQTVRIGDTVQLSGVVQSLPGEPSRLGLSQRQIDLAEQRDVYIEAHRLNRVGR